MTAKLMRLDRPAEIAEALEAALRALDALETLDAGQRAELAQIAALAASVVEDEIAIVAEQLEGCDVSIRRAAMLAAEAGEHGPLEHEIAALRTAADTAENIGRMLRLAAGARTAGVIEPARHDVKPLSLL